MTIAAGFVCQDGLILCADTEESLTTFKVRTPKLYMQPTGDLRWAIVGSGWSSSVELAIQKIWDGLSGLLVETVDAAHTAIEQVVADVYKTYIFPDPEGSKRDFSLLIGLWDKSGETLLLRTDRLVVIRVSEREVIGCGWELASYLLDQTYDPKMGIARGMILATHVLMETKKYVQNCGGDSHIIRIGKDGFVNGMSLDQISDQETFLTSFNAAIRPVMFAGPDLNVSGSEFGEVVARAAQTIETLRSTRFQQVRLPPQE